MKLNHLLDFQSFFLHIIIRRNCLWKTFKDVVKNEKVKGLWMGTIPVGLLYIKRWYLCQKRGVCSREVSVVERYVSVVERCLY